MQDIKWSPRSEISRPLLFFIFLYGKSPHRDNVSKQIHIADQIDRLARCSRSRHRIRFLYIRIHSISHTRRNRDEKNGGDAQGTNSNRHGQSQDSLGLSWYSRRKSKISGRIHGDPVRMLSERKKTGRPQRRNQCRWWKNLSLNV